MQHTLIAKSDMNKSTVLDPLKNSLLSLYPEKDGWKLYNRYNWATKVFDYILQKEVGGQLYRVLVEINFENHVGTEHFDKLNSLAKRLNAGNCILAKKIMIIDDMASTENLPADIHVVQISTLLKSELLSINTGKEKLVA